MHLHYRHQWATAVRPLGYRFLLPWLKCLWPGCLCSRNCRYVYIETAGEENPANRNNNKTASSKFQSRRLLSLLFRWGSFLLLGPSGRCRRPVNREIACRSADWLNSRRDTQHWFAFLWASGCRHRQMVLPPSPRRQVTCAATTAARHWRWSRRGLMTAPATRVWRVTRRCGLVTRSGNASTPASPCPCSVSLSALPVSSPRVCSRAASHESVSLSALPVSSPRVCLFALPIMSLWVYPLEYSTYIFSLEYFIIAPTDITVIFYFRR